MGGCVSHDRNHQGHHDGRSHSSRSSATNSGAIRRNKPLNRSACRPKWKSDVPISENQLRRKREEYWDTAPAFEGRKEIWDALRGACYAIEQNDIDLAQSILNCANVTLPHGTLLDCYDELGTRYQLPVYVLTPPTNLLDAERSSIDSRADNESGISDAGLATIAAVDRERDLNGQENSHSSASSSSTTIRDRTTIKSSNITHSSEPNPIIREIKKHRRKQKSTTNQTNNDSGNDVSSNASRTPPNIGQQQQDAEIPIKFRLSNGREHRLYCKSTEKMRTIKRRLAMLENGSIDLQVQRLFFGGKLLRDRSTVADARLQRNFVVQVILNEMPLTPNGAITTTSHMGTNSDSHTLSLNPTPIEVPISSTSVDRINSITCTN